MPSPALPSANPSPGWIIAPAWDLLFFVLTPVLIIPAVWAGERVFSAEQIWLVAISFFSVGHHLPGFLRAYGDRDLWQRFHWRFLLVPPAIFAAAWWCETQHLHGLRVIVLLWATWHGLMQTYGFMRIYDLKRGVRDPWSARLDFWLCVTLFASGVVWSEPRLFGLLQAFYDAGGPVLPTAAVQSVQWALGVATVAVAVVWLGNLVARAARNQPVSWLKAGLALSTAAIWWICGATPNTLVGVAMFEIYHAVQYLAIVWVFQRGGLAARPAASRWLLLVAYLGLIAAFGGVRFGLADHVQTVWFSSLLATSTLLHYYYDGFIWKVRERVNQSRLRVESAAESKPTKSEPAGPAPTEPRWAALVHVAKWGLVGVALGAFWQLEQATTAASATARTTRRQQVTASLADAAPGLADAQRLKADAALDAGDLPAARAAAEAAVRLAPRSAEAQGVLGHVLLAQGDHSGALTAYDAAVSLAPNASDHAYNLAGALVDAGELAQAEQAYLRARELASGEALRADIQRDLTQLYLRQAAKQCDAGHYSDAAAQLAEAAPLATAAHPDQQQAIADLTAILVLEPKNETMDALSVRQALERGNSLQVEAGLARLTGGAPLPPGLLPSALGAALLKQDREGEALTAFQAALQANSNNAAAHLAVGRILWERAAVEERLGLPAFGTNSAARARQHLEHARRLGATLPAELSW